MGVSQTMAPKRVFCMLEITAGNPMYYTRIRACINRHVNV